MIALLIKASLVIIVLLAFYKIFLEKESFFAVNRMYLLGCLVAAFTLPFLCLPQLIEQQGIVSTLMEESNPKTFSATPNEVFLTENKSYENPNQELVKEIPTQEKLPQKELTIPMETKTETTDQPEKQQATKTITTTEAPPTTTKGIGYWLLLIYFFGVVVLSFNLFAQIVNTLLKVAKNDDKIEDEEGTIVNMTTESEPCSFFKYIFINPASYDYETYEQILAHEKIHVKQMHSIDLLLSELVVIVLWFNPFVWKLRTEVEKNIEYQTDDLLVDKEPEEKEEYQLNLVKIATYTKPLTITTNYNQSLIKQRILKMNTKKSNSYGYWKYTFIAPLIFGIVLFLNKPISSFAQSENLSMLNNENVAQPISSIAPINEIADEPQDNDSETDDTIVGNREEVENNQSDIDAEGKTDCEKLLKAAKKDDVKKVRKILASFDFECLPTSDEESLYNLSFIKFLAGNEGEILIDTYNEKIVVKGKVIGLGNHNYEVHENFGNRIKSKCTDIEKAIQLEDATRVRELLLKLDKDCIERSDDPQKLADLALTKEMLRNGADIQFSTIKMVIEFDEITNGFKRKSGNNFNYIEEDTYYS